MFYAWKHYVKTRLHVREVLALVKDGKKKKNIGF